MAGTKTKNKQSEWKYEEQPPLVMTVSISRSTNLLSTAHNIFGVELNGQQDIAMLIEALAQITADLKETETQIRIQEAVQQNAQENPEGQ